MAGYRQYFVQILEGGLKEEMALPSVDAHPLSPLVKKKKKSFAGFYVAF